MEPIHDPEVLARVQATLDLYEASEEIMRQNLHRRHPEESDAEIERRFLAWLWKLPGPEALPAWVKISRQNV
jgi:hypothetical protein